MSGPELELNAALRQLAASAKNLEAPPAVEAAVLCAFRRRRGVRGSRWMLRLAAAVVLALLGGAAGLLLRPQRREVVTEFAPLLYGDDWRPLDGGRLVRVRLPRSALSRFGLPVSQDRAAEPIHADVLVGHDGLARAVRLVEWKY